MALNFGIFTSNELPRESVGRFFQKNHLRVILLFSHQLLISTSITKTWVSACKYLLARCQTNGDHHRSLVEHSKSPTPLHRRKHLPKSWYVLQQRPRHSCVEFHNPSRSDPSASPASKTLQVIYTSTPPASTATPAAGWHQMSLRELTTRLLLSSSPPPQQPDTPPCRPFSHAPRTRNTAAAYHLDHLEPPLYLGTRSTRSMLPQVSSLLPATASPDRSTPLRRASFTWVTMTQPASRLHPTCCAALLAMS